MNKKRYLLVTLSLVTIGTLAALLFLQSEPGKRFVIARVQAYLENRYSLSLDLEEFSYSLFRLTVSLRGLSIGKTGDKNLPDLVKVDRGHFKLNALDLLLGHLAIKGGDLQGVSVNAFVSEDGSSNLPSGLDFAAVEEDASEAHFLVGSLNIIDGSAVLRNDSRRIHFDLPDWSLEVTGDRSTGDHTIVFVSHSGSELGIGNKTLLLEQFEAKSSLSSKGLRLDSFDIRWDQTQLKASGTVADEIEANIEVSVDATQVVQLLGLKEPFSGLLEGTLRLGDSIEAPSLEARLSGKNLTWRGIDISESKAAVEWSIRESLVIAKEVDFVTPYGSLRGQGRIALTEEAGTSETKMQVVGFDLKGISDFFRSKYEFASTISGELDFLWPGLKVSQLVGSAALSLSESRKSLTAGQLPLSGELFFKSTSDDFELSLDKISSIGAELSGNARIERPGLRERLALGRLEGRVSGYIDDLGLATSGLIRLLGHVERPYLPVSGRMEVSAGFSGTLARPRASVTLEASGIETPAAQDIDIKLAGEIDQETVRLSDVTLLWRGSRVSAAGAVLQIDTASELAFQGSIDSFPLHDLGLVLDLPIDSEGELSGNFDVAGTISTPRLTFEAQVPQLKLAGDDLGSTKLIGDLENGLLRIPTLDVREPLSDGGDLLTASGQIDLYDQTFSFEASGDQLDITTMQAAGNWELAGMLGFTMRGQGNLDHPELELRLDLVDSSVFGYGLGPINLKASLLDRQFEVNALATSAGLTARAVGETAFPYPVSIIAESDHLDLSKLPCLRQVAPDLTGFMEGEVRAEGQLAHWSRGQIDLRFANLSLAWRDLQVRNLRPVHLAYSNRSLRIERSVLAIGSGSLEVEGQLPLVGSQDREEVITKIDLDVADLIQLLPTHSDLKMTGKLDSRVEVAGSLKRPQLSGELRIREGTLESPNLPIPISDLRADFSLSGNSMELDELLATAGGGKLWADGEIPLGFLLSTGDSESEPIRVSASLEDFPVESLGIMPKGTGGVATAQVEVTAPEPNFKSVAAAAAFGQLRLSAGELSLQQTEPALLTLQNGQLWIERAELVGPDSKLRGSGGVDFMRPGNLNIELKGSVSTTLLAELVGNLESSGVGQVELSVGGLPGEPRISGTLNVDGGTLLIPSLDLQVDELELCVQASNNRFQIDRLAGDLNGGSFQGDGAVLISSGEMESVELVTVLTDVVLELPEGLNTISDGVVAIRSTERGFLLDGEIRVLEGAYREEFDLGGSLVRYLETGRRVDIALDQNPLLAGLEFEMGVETIDPIIFDNNLAEVALQGRVELKGSYYRPGMLGVITVDPGGEIYLREKTYFVEYGAISFLEDSRIRPELDVRAWTRAQEYDVTLQVTGPLSDLKTSFSSDPPLAEPDVVSILLTGRTLEELRGAEATVAQEQALSLLAGAAGGEIGRQVEDAFGLTKVRIEPYLIAPESKPETRLTIGQDITSDLRGIYSVNLADSGDQIWVGEYDVTRRFRGRGIKQADNTYRIDFNHRLRFPRSGQSGGSSQRRQVRSIRFEGSHAFPESLLLDRFDVEPGQAYDFFKTQRGLDKVRGLFSDRDLLEARLRLRRSESDGDVDLTMRIEGGPKVALSFEGGEIPSATRKRVRSVWSRGVSDTQRKRESLQEIRRWLVEQGHYQAKASCMVSYAENTKRATFYISKGPKFEETTVVFQGVEAFETERLRSELEAEDLVLPLFLEPVETTGFLVGLYRNKGFLDVKVEPQETVFDIQNSKAQVVLHLLEGPLYQVGEIQFKGNRVFDDMTLGEAAGIAEGDVFYPNLLGEVTVRLEDFYWSRGYNELKITDSAERAENHRIDLLFEIVENIQDVVQEIKISGQNRVGAGFIRKQMGLEIGTILDLEMVSRARKRLYDTGAFSLVEIEPVEIQQNRAEKGAERPMRLEVKVRETVPHRINYGAFFDTDRGPGLTIDYRNHNLLRNGRVLGLSSRVDGDRREVRGYFSQPARYWFPLRTIASTSFAREFRPTFEFDEVGFSVEQQAELKDTLIGSYGFSYIENRIREKDSDSPIEDRPLNVGSLSAALAWDTRDSFLEPTGGHFFSNAFQFAPAQFGSDFPYIKYFGGYSRYFPLAESSRLPFGGDTGRPRLIFATWVRVGLAKGFDQDTISPTERFFAGGGTTIRGFKQDTVGPVNENGEAVGGNSLFIWNNELRFPMFSFLDGVGFLDVGNVYPTLSDFDPFEVRKAAGIGLRVRTPFVLIRFDYGFKLDRQPGESRGAFFFSIGQAF